MGKREPLPLPTVVASPHVDTRFERGRDALVRADEPAKKAEKAMEGTQDEQEEDDQTAEEQLPDDEGAVEKSQSCQRGDDDEHRATAFFVRRARHVAVDSRSTVTPFGTLSGRYRRALVCRFRGRIRCIDGQSAAPSRSAS